MIKATEIFVRSTIFNVFFFGLTAVMALMTLPAVFMPRAYAMTIPRIWTRMVYVLEKTLIGLDYEVCGIEHLPKEGSFIIAAKHQSAYETMKLHILFHDPAIVLKRELLKIPVWGLFLAKIDPVAIDRSSREEAINSLLRGASHVKSQNRPIIIFPQGTRVSPDETTDKRPYKSGITRMYESSGMAVVPMALNTGLYWPKMSWIKKPGKVTFEFMPPIKPGLSNDEFLKTLRDTIETASENLRDNARKEYVWL